MPRLDQKRQKQGRPKDAATAGRGGVFGEQFTPGIQGGGQQQLFIRPQEGPVDRPSQLSFGNMTPGPSGGLQVLQGLAGGLTQGFKAMQEFYNDRTRKQNDRITEIENENFVRVQYTNGTSSYVKVGSDEYNKLDEELRDPSITSDYRFIDDPSYNFTVKRNRINNMLPKFTAPAKRRANRLIQDLALKANIDFNNEEAEEFKNALAVARSERNSFTAVKDLLLKYKGKVVEGTPLFDLYTAAENSQAQSRADLVNKNLERQIKSDLRSQLNNMQPHELMALPDNWTETQLENSGAFDDLLNIDRSTMSDADIDATYDAFLVEGEFFFDLVEEMELEVIEKRESALAKFSDDLKEQTRAQREETLNDLPLSQRITKQDILVQARLENIPNYDSIAATDPDRLAIEKTRIKRKVYQDLVTALVDQGSDPEVIRATARSLGISDADSKAVTLEGLVTQSAIELANQMGIDLDSTAPQAQLNAQSIKALVGQLAVEEQQINKAVKRLAGGITPDLQDELDEINRQKDILNTGSTAEKIQLLRDRGYLEVVPDLDEYLGTLLGDESFKNAEKAWGQTYNSDVWQPNADNFIADGIEKLTTGAATDNPTFEDYLQTGGELAVSAELGIDFAFLDQDRDVFLEIIDEDETGDLKLIQDKMTASRKQQDPNAPEATEAEAAKVLSRLDEHLQAKKDYFDSEVDSQRQEYDRAVAARQRAIDDARKDAQNADGEFNPNKGFIFNPQNSQDRTHNLQFENVMGGVFTQVRTNFIRGDMPSQLYSIPGMQALVPLIDNAQRRELNVALRDYNVDTNPDTIISYIDKYLPKDPQTNLPNENEREQALEVFELLAYDTYKRGGFDFKNVPSTNAGRLVYASIAATLVNSTTQGFNPQTYTITNEAGTVNITPTLGDKTLGALRQGISDAIEAIDRSADGQTLTSMERFDNQSRIELEIVRQIMFQRDMEEAGDNEVERQKVASRYQSMGPGIVTTSDFEKIAQEVLGMSDNELFDFQIQASIFPNFTSEGLENLTNDQLNEVKRLRTALYNRSTGAVVTSADTYREGQEKFVGSFNRLMAEMRDAGVDADVNKGFGGIIDWVYTYATGQPITDDFMDTTYEAMTNLSKDRQEELLAAFAPYVSNQDADFDAQAVEILGRLNTASAVEGVNPIVAIRTMVDLARKGGFVQSSPVSFEAVLGLALQPIEVLAGDGTRISYGPMGDAIVLSEFTPDISSTTNTTTGTRIFSSADDNLAASLVTDIDFFRLTALQREPGAFNPAQIVRLDEEIKSFQKAFNAFNKTDGVDVLTASIISDLMYANATGRESEIASRLAAGLEKISPDKRGGLSPNFDYTTVAGIRNIQQVVYVASNYLGDKNDNLVSGTVGESTVSPTRTQQGYQIFSINPNRELNEYPPNYQSVIIFDRPIELALGARIRQPDGSVSSNSYIDSNRKTLPRLLADAGNVVRTTGVDPFQDPRLSRTAGGFYVPTADLSPDQAYRSMKRAQAAYDTDVAAELVRRGYVTVDSKGRIKDIKNEVYDADRDLVIPLELALAEIQQPLLARTAVLEQQISGEINPYVSRLLERLDNEAGSSRGISLLGLGFSLLDGDIQDNMVQSVKEVAGFYETPTGPKPYARFVDQKPEFNEIRIYKDRTRGGVPYYLGGSFADGLINLFSSPFSPAPPMPRELSPTRAQLINPSVLEAMPINIENIRTLFTGSDPMSDAQGRPLIVRGAYNPGLTLISEAVDDFVGLQDPIMTQPPTGVNPSAIRQPQPDLPTGMQTPAGGDALVAPPSIPEMLDFGPVPADSQAGPDGKPVVVNPTEVNDYMASRGFPSGAAGMVSKVVLLNALSAVRPVKEQRERLDLSINEAGKLEANSRFSFNQPVIGVNDTLSNLIPVDENGEFTGLLQYLPADFTKYRLNANFGLDLIDRATIDNVLSGQRNRDELRMQVDRFNKTAQVTDLFDYKAFARDFAMNILKGDKLKDNPIIDKAELFKSPITDAYDLDNWSIDFDLDVEEIVKTGTFRGSIGFKYRWEF